MSNSPLATFTQLSPNHSGRRKYPLSRVSVHCYVGQVTLERMGKGFADPKREASCNYGVDKDGRVGLFVEEGNRSWCTSNEDNDQRAVTIEVASGSTHPYTVNEKAMEGLVALLTDICRRNEKKRLVWMGSKAISLSYTPKTDELLMTVHRWFANKACPGAYLYSRHGEIAAEVTRRLKGDEADMTAEDVKKLVAQEVEAQVKPLNEALAKAIRDMTPVVYHSVEEAPEWAREELQEAIERGLLKGDETGDLGLTDGKLSSVLLALRAMRGGTGKA